MCIHISFSGYEFPGFSNQNLACDWESWPSTDIFLNWVEALKTPKINNYVNLHNLLT